MRHSPYLNHWKAVITPSNRVLYATKVRCGVMWLLFVSPKRPSKVSLVRTNEKATCSAMFAVGAWHGRITRRMTGEVSRALNRFQTLHFRPKQNIEHSTLLHTRHCAGFSVLAGPWLRPRDMRRRKRCNPEHRQLGVRSRWRNQTMCPLAPRR